MLSEEIKEEYLYKDKNGLRYIQGKAIRDNTNFKGWEVIPLWESLNNLMKRENAYWEGYSQKQNEAIEICKQCKYIKKVKQLESDNKKLKEINDKYLQKLVFALTPTTHELSTDNNNAFKQIIADNIDLETCKIKRKLKEFWGVDKY